MQPRSFPFPDPTTPWARCYVAFLAHVTRDHSAATASIYTGILNDFITASDTSLGERSREDVQTFVERATLSRDRRATQPPSTKYKRNRLYAIKAFYDFAATSTEGAPLFAGRNPAYGIVTAPALPRGPKNARHGPPPDPFAPESDWARCFAHFLQQIGERSGAPGTAARYRQILSDFFSSGKAPEEYTREDIENFIHHPYRDLPVKPGTMNNRLSAISSFYKYAMTFGVQGPDGKPYPLFRQISPTAAIRLQQVDMPPYKAMSAEELQRFIAAIPTDTLIGLRDRAYCLTLFWTARRRTEIRLLQWGDLERTTIIDGSARREGYIFHWHGKGRQRQTDTAELPEPARAAIWAWLEASGRLETMQPGDYLFTTDPTHGDYDPRRPLETNTLYQAIKRYARLAGFDPRQVAPHSFRHTAARIRYESGSDIREVSRLLRHSNIATTDRYLSILAGNADPGAAALVARFGGL